MEVEHYTVVATIRRQMSFFHHTMRRQALENIVVTGKINSRQVEVNRDKRC